MFHVKHFFFLSSFHKINMLSGPLCKNILFFALPIALSSMLQQLFNAADTAIVGFFDTASSLAAVGTNGEIIAFIVSLSSGLSIGVNVFIAQQIGQEKKKSISAIINTSLLLAVLIGIIGLFIGQCISASLLYLIQTPADILAPATLYLRIYLLGYPFLILYDFASAILKAQGNSRYPFIALTISGITNVLLNILFIVVFKIGIAGVAIATVLSTMICAILVICRLKSDASTFHFSLTLLKMEPKFIIPILKIGIPSAIQGAIFCFANIFIQACVNGFGSYAIAGSTIAMNFEYFTYYIIIAFGQTATTFISQNYAAGQKSSKTCLLAHYVYSLFESLCSLYEVPAGILRGSGHSFYPAFATIIGTCCFRIIWIYSVFKHYHELKVLYIAFPLSWILTIFLIFIGFIIIRPIKQTT